MVRNRVLPVMRPRDFIVARDVGFSGFLDDSNGAGASNYWAIDRGGSDVDVESRNHRQRRSSDNGELDISYDAATNKWDVEAREDHAGVGDAFMITWDDQIASLDVTQATTTKQPKTVSSGTALAAPLFDDAASQVLNIDTAAWTSQTNHSVLSWARIDDAAAASSLWFNGVKEADNKYWLSQVRADIANDPMRFAARNVASSTVIDHPSIVAADTWFSHLGVIVASDSRKSYVNGANEGTETTDVSITTANRFSIGALNRASPVHYMSGDIARVAIWPVDKSGVASELHALGNPAA